MKSKNEQQSNQSRRAAKHSSAPARTLLHTKRPDAEVDSVPIEFDDERFDQCCRSIRVALVRPTPSPMEAHAALDRFLVSLQIKESLTLESPISLLQYYGDCSLEVKEINELERSGYVTVRSFLGATDQDLLMVRNFGMVTLVKLNSVRAKLRLELKLDRAGSRIESILRGDPG